MRIAGIIPARYASTRFPGKPLAMLAGQSMIMRTYLQAKKALEDVWVATDDHRIFDHVLSNGGKAIITSENHLSGTDRIKEAAEKIKEPFDYFVNIQGDEPLIDPSQIRELLRILDGSTEIATQARIVKEKALLTNPNLVKLVIDKNGNALYFTRAVIPYERNSFSGSYLQHIGIYAYRRDILMKVADLEPTPLELSESLEQLRWLENGMKIRVTITSAETIGIDTPEDLEKAETYLKARNLS